jgi:TRAP-type C4-dicarboxylate transport system substrate-binding protein
MSDLMTLPFVTCPTTEQASLVLWDFVEKFPNEFAKEYGEVKLFTMHNGDPTMVGTIKKPIKTVEDMQGLNLKANSGPQTDFAKALKANPQMVSVGDAYDAMSKGVIDGFISDWPAVESFKWYEIVKYYLEVYINHNVFWVVINKDKWNSFPADIQSKMMTVGGKAGAQFFGKVWDGIVNNTKTLVKGMAGKEVTTLSKEEATRWKALAKPIYDSYVAKLEAKGLPGKQALEYLLQRIDATWK